MTSGNSLFLIGLGFLLLGIILIFASSLFMNKDNVKFAGGVLIGPVPLFGFFSDKKMFWALMGLFVLGIIIWLLNRRDVI